MLIIILLKKIRKFGRRNSYISKRTALNAKAFKNMILAKFVNIYPAMYF